MKIVKTATSEISLAEVLQNPEKYYLVGKIDGHPVIGHYAQFDTPNSFSFFSLSDDFMNGNGFSGGGMEKIFERHLGRSNAELRAFTNWRDALQWLIDNG